MQASRLVILVILEAVSFGQQLPAIPPIQLPPPITSIRLQKDRTVKGLTPAFGYYGPVKCDSDGNIYLRSSENGFNRSHIIKLSSKAEKKAEFAVPKEFPSPEEYFTVSDYAVDFDGNVYILGSTSKEQYLLHFDDDGKYQGKVKLDLPESVEVENVAVFRSGEIFATGHYSSDAKETLVNKGYAALLRADGTLHKRISTDYVKGKPEPKFDRSKMNSGYALPGMDGNVYNLRSNRILVINPGGEIQRTIAVTAPGEEYLPSKLLFSAGILSVEFAKVENHRVMPLFRTYSSDGEFLREYLPGPELKNSPLCFSVDDGYTFSGSENGMMTIMHASIK